MKFSILVLVGAASAAPSPLPTNTAWPARTGATLVTTGSNQEDNADYITDVYSKVGTVNAGPYRAFRNGLYVFPTQNITKATATPGDKGAVVAQSTASRTFWVSAPETGVAYAAKSTGAATAANGPVWTVCKDAAALLDNAKCNGGPTKNADTKSYNTPYRIVFKVNNSAAITVGSESETFPATTWNQDILMASLYQSSYTGAAVEDGTKWCSDWKNSINSDGTNQAVLAAQKGLSGRSKCTWLILTSDGNAAPGFRLTYADFVGFNFQWIEWITIAGLGTKGVLPATEAANYFLGNYPTAGGVFLNPVTAGIPVAETTWGNSQISLAYQEKDPRIRLPGSVGDIIFYPAREGVFKDTQTITIDSGFFLRDVMAKRKENEDYEMKKDDYNQKRTKYDDSADKLQKREKDLFSKSFSPSVNMPERPERPERPIPYVGPNIDLLRALATTPIQWKNSLVDQGDFAVLKNGATNAPSADLSTRLGYLQASNDTSKVGATGVLNLRDAGHVFGRLGQGVASYPGNAQAFYWGAKDATNTPGMLVSVFPEADTDAGLDTAKQNVTIIAKAVPWVNLADFKAPPQPELPPEAKKDPRASSASSIAAGLIASVSVLYSLY